MAFRKAVLGLPQLIREVQRLDVDFFLKERTAFIQHYYDEAAAPFVETMSKIEAEEAPYQPPPFNPDTMSLEPAFLQEWLRAQAGFQMVGQTCLSMLSDTLKIFFMTHEDINGFDCISVCEKGLFKKKGFIHGYRSGFAHYGVDWAQCPVSFDILEQVVLARNAAQHGSHITTTSVSHKRDDLAKYPNPVFISDHERELMERWGGSWLVEPSIHVSPEALQQAIGEAEKLADWMSSIDFRALRKKHHTPS